MKEPRTPVTLRVPPRRQHPRLLLERDNVSIMRQTFSAEHQPFKLRRPAPTVARYPSLNLLEFVNKKIKRTPIQHIERPAMEATRQVAPPLVISRLGSQSDSMVDTTSPIDQVPSQGPSDPPTVNSPPVSCVPVNSPPVSCVPVNSSPVSLPSTSSPSDKGDALAGTDLSSAPFPSDQRDAALAETEPVIQRKTKSIRSRADRVTWYYTCSRTAISAASTSPLSYSHELCTGDLRLHKSQQNEQLQSWVWDGSQWVEIKHGDVHLNLPGYRLKLVGDEPSWVTRKTVVDDMGRAKRAASAAVQS
ncbi:hypothetical protein P692DRAFT_20879413 [Suillus brevipes Sb2]|nr:hypothetical protein P692DRAFT_20879413 [Suillus brevipes Sb2]